MEGVVPKQNTNAPASAEASFSLVCRPAESLDSYQSPSRKPSPLRLNEPRFISLSCNLAQDGRVKGGVRSLATGTGAESFAPTWLRSALCSSTDPTFQAPWPQRRSRSACLRVCLPPARQWAICSGLRSNCGGVVCSVVVASALVLRFLAPDFATVAFCLVSAAGLVDYDRRGVRWRCLQREWNGTGKADPSWRCISPVDSS